MSKRQSPLLPFPTERNQGSLEKTEDFKAWARKVQVSLEHFAVSESKEVLEERWGHVKRTQETV